MREKLAVLVKYEESWCHDFKAGVLTFRVFEATKRVYADGVTMPEGGWRATLADPVELRWQRTVERRDGGYEPDPYRFYGMKLSADLGTWAERKLLQRVLRVVGDCDDPRLILIKLLRRGVVVRWVGEFPAEYVETTVDWGLMVPTEQKEAA